MAFTTPDYEAPTANNERSLLIDVSPMNQSVEHMVGSIVGYRSTLEIFRQRYDS
ncbi:hypothetical protein [Geomesophilobacter sediminis]|uniref:Uncharacterized protein n=1 Tax=Geomesophilobacter sediminis TaxID=2798584 RepID=A0A8J7SA88_9BACT|nr:hypothetical protein [Geomesophilobacter sediminis]MBJ6727345.1 hypothetical protein [Geomesophilobacter sediminis]